MSDSEDGGTLGSLFQGVEDAKARLAFLMSQQARLARAARVQILLSVRAGKEKEVEDQLLQYADAVGICESGSELRQTKGLLTSQWAFLQA